jgi:CHAT domain-containing protein
VLCLLHSSLPGAAQSQSNSAISKQIDATIEEARKLRASGDFVGAIGKFNFAARSAEQIGDLGREASALAQSSSCHQFAFQYSLAIQTAKTARALALRAHDDTTAGGAALVLSSAYRLLGDLELARKESEYSINKLANSSQRDLLAKAFLNQAGLDALEGKNAEALAAAARAVSVAQQAGLTRIEGVAWDISGILHVLAGNIPQAEQALNKAVAIRTNLHDTDNLAVTHEHLAELELKEGNYAAALKFIDQAFAADTPAFRVNPQYYPIHVRAQILLGLGRTHDALVEFRHAVDIATEWRSGALPGDVTSTFTVIQLHDVYADYAELAATLALKNHDSALARDALEALAENRAASLREQLALSLGKEMRLPPEYFELVSAVQKEQAQVTLRENPQEHEAKLRELRVQLSDLENKIGLELLDNSPRQENNPHKNSLRNIQSRLGSGEVLLSFCLGRHQSFVWAVTGDDVKLYELPDESAIANQAKAFANAARSNQENPVPGAALSQTLFGQLRPAIWGKRDWLLTLDGALLDGIPFSALPTPRNLTTTLASGHTLRLVPSELLLLQPKSATPAPVFIGIADPIYNLADSRRVQNLPIVPARHSNGTINLARLVGSDTEIRSGAKLSGISESELLTGVHASGSALRQATARRPQILHFAVHVVSPPARPQEAALALSLTNDGMPELLTSEVISTYRVPGSLVIMSGCASQQGQTLPSAGLLGLSRAWLLAGASAVVVSAWPTPDDSGQFFSAFYSHLQKDSGSLARRASAALEEAQLDMQRGGGYRSLPSFWSAYSIIAKE